MKDQQIDRLADAIVDGLQRKIDQEVRAMPTPPPKESGLFRLFMAAAIVAVVVAVSLAGFNFFAPALLGTQAAPQVTALPTLPPRPTTPPYQPVQQLVAPPTAAPQATTGAVIVVTPTYGTGCHEGVSYVDGVAVNGVCAGAAFAPELPTATVQVFATAVPPDAVYMDALRKQAPHCIRCAP